MSDSEEEIIDDPIIIQLSEEGEKLFKEIVKDIATDDINDFKLYGRTSFGDLLKYTKQIDLSKESLFQFMNFDLDADIDLSCLDELLPKDKEEEEQILSSKYEKVDNDLIQSIIAINSICDNNSEVSLSNIRTIIGTEDFITKFYLEKCNSEFNINMNLAGLKDDTNLGRGRRASTKRKKFTSTDLYFPEEGTSSNSILEFIDSLERIKDNNNNNNNTNNNTNNNNNQKNKNINYSIDEYIDTQKIKINILNGDLLSKLKEKINRIKDCSINFYKYSPFSNEIFIGTSTGDIHIYNLKTQNEKNGFIGLQFKDSKAPNPALCIDIKDNIIAVGFQRGQVNLWKNEKLIDTIEKDPVIKNPIICIKIIKIKGKKISYLTSDQKGNLTLTKRVETLFSPKISHEKIYENLPNPIFKIDFMEYKIFVVQGDSVVETTIKVKNMFFLFGTVEDVKIVKIKPKVREIFTYKKPLNLIDSESIPDFCFGKGFLPKLEDTFFKTITNNDKNFKVKPDTIFDLLAISWGQEVLLFCILDVNNHTSRKLSMVCRYVHKKSIFKIGFICNSFIYIIDKDEITIRNTKLFCNEENLAIINEDYLGKIGLKNFRFTKDKNISNKQLHQIMKNQNINLLEEDFENCFDGTLFSQSANFPKKNYYGKILTIDRGIIIFTKNNIKIFRLLKWKTVLENLAEENLWGDILSIGTELIEKHNKYFLPMTMEHGSKYEGIKGDLIETFKGFIFRFFNSILINTSVDIKISLDYIIEFCVKVNLTNFLFQNFFDLVIIKNLTNIFFERLEKYIFLGCFKDVANIPEKIINEIILYYIMKKRKIYLSKILLHFNAVALSYHQIRQCIIDNDLINVFIYMYMNSPELENYFRPVIMIYTLMTQKKDNENYVKFITTHQKDLYNDDIISSKQYFGHRLLWYANFCLNGVKYPNYDEMKKDLYKDIIIKLLLFLLSKSDKLIYFDSFSFFQIMNRFFLEEELFKNICIKYDEYESFIDTINFELEINVSQLGPNFFICFLIDKCKEIEDNFFIMKDLYDFLSNIAEKNLHNSLNIDKNILMDAIEFYVTYNSNKSQSYHDPFSCHQYTFTDYSQEKDLIEEKIIAILNYLGDKLSKEEINNILEKYEIGAFNNVKVVLLNKIHSYTESFEIQIKKINKDKKDPAQIQMLFEYINNILSELKAKKDNESLENMKNAILNKLAELSEISLDDVTNLVDNWFNDQQEKVITKLSISPSLQLKYVQNFIKIHSKNSKFKIHQKNSDIENKNLELNNNNNNNQQQQLNSISTNENDYNSIKQISRTDTYSSSYEGDEIDTGSSSSEGSDNAYLIHPNNYGDAADMGTSTDISQEKMNTFYVMEIQLLCELKRKEDVYNIVCKNINICNEDVLKILLANKVYDAAIYVYRAIGGYDDGVELTKTVIDKNYKKILRNLSSENFKDKINDMLLEKHKKYLELGISICQRVSESHEEAEMFGYGQYGQDPSDLTDINKNWLHLLEALYQTKSNIQSYIKQNSNNDKTYFYNKINETISFSIELTLGKMCDYLKLPTVITIVTEQIKGVTIDFKEFKKLLLGMIFSLNQMENILKIVKIILHKNILNEHEKYKYEFNTGTLFFMSKGCDLCHKSLKIEDAYYYVFKCGHRYHETCCYKDRCDMHFCILCKRQEIEKSVTTLAEYIQIIKENESSTKAPVYEIEPEPHRKMTKINKDKYISLHKNKISSENVAKLKKMMKRTNKFIEEGDLINCL